MMDAAQKTPAGLTKKGSILIQRQVLVYAPSKKAYKNDLTKSTMSDIRIENTASKQAFDSYNNSKARKVEKGLFFVGMPVAASIITGALTPAKSIAEKVGNSLKTAKYIGVAMAAMIGVYKGVDVATQKIPVLKKIRQDHPELTTIGSLASAGVATMGANTVVGKVEKVGFIEKNIVKPLSEKLAKFGENLNKHQAIDNKLFNPIKNFFENTRTGNKIAKWGVPLVTGGVVLKFLADLNGISSNKQQIKKQLEQDRKESLARVVNNPFVNSKKSGMRTIIERTRIFIIPEKKKV